MGRVLRGMYRDDVAAILGRAGMSVQDAPVSSEALGLPGSIRARKLVELDSLFSVYWIESSVSSFPFAELGRALERSGEDALALVIRGGKDSVALHAAAGGPTVRADLSDTEVETLLSNLSAWPESDALTVSENIHRLVEYPRVEERAYQNRGLFSNHYLKHRLTDPRQNPEWSEHISDAYKEFLSLYEEKKHILDGLNEAQTESEFLEPALRILGFSFIKQAKTEAGNRPDFALFVNELTKNAAFADQDDPPKFYASALSILEGKYWRRELDQTRKSDPRDLIAYKSSPEMQTVG
jgi:hypothetical protein